MGFFDWLFQNPNQVPTVNSILPDAAKQEIYSGRLPRLNTDRIFLRKGEYCCYIDKAILMYDKTKKVYRHHSVSYPGIFKGDRHSSGRGQAEEYIETQQFKALLFITNQRIILQCKEQGFDKPYRSLSAIKPYANALELQFGAKTYSIILPEGNVAYQAIKLVQQNRQPY